MAKKAPHKKDAAPAKKAAKPSPKARARVAKRPTPPPPPVQPKPLKRSPLNKGELEEYRKLLLDKRRSLIGDMSGMESEALRTNRQEGSGDLSLMPDHPANIATDNFEQEFTLGLLESERSLLTEINDALERIDNGTFGICLGTGQFIGKARLKARPWAKYCIEFARMIEKGQVRPGKETTEMPEEEPAEEEEEETFDEEMPEPEE